MWDKFLYNWSQGKRLATMPWQVIKHNKGLILFPLISSLTILAFSTACVWLLYTANNSQLNLQTFYDFLIKELKIMDEVAIFLDRLELNGTESFTKTDVVYFVLYGLTINFIFIFFNAALVANAMVIMGGQKISFIEAINISMQRIFKLIGWTLLLTIVGFLLNLMEKRSQIIGKIMARLIGVTFSIASFLVLPVMLYENKNPFSALGRSTYLLHNTWGKQIMGRMGFGVVFFILHLMGLAFTYLAFTIFPKFCALYLAILVLYFIFLGALQVALSGIFQGAIYLYATTGQVPKGFDEQIIAETFTLRS